MDLLNQITSLTEQLSASVRALRKTGQDFAEAQMNYRIALAQKITELEATGRPVTNLLYIAKGDKNVARAKYEEICKEAIYKANLESINAIKVNIRILDTQYQKEWSVDE